MYTYDSDGNPIDDFGNIIYDPWVQEGLKEEEYYAMQAVDQAYTDELHESIEDEYKKLQALHITKDIKYLDFNKIGFNNFKPFGEKIQSFSKKPITLIYGPNSIGKSSFIHMQAYMRYIFEAQSFDLSNTDMFGDNINLGGFDKFIHKRDKNNSIKIEFEFDDCSDAIIDYLKLDSIDYTYINLLRKFTKNDLIEIIKSSHQYTNSSTQANRFCNKIFKEEYDFFANNDGAFRDSVQYESGRVNTQSAEHNNPFAASLEEQYKINQWNVSLIRNEGLKCENTDANHPISYHPNILLEKYYKKNPYYYDDAFEIQSKFSQKPYSNDVEKFSNEEDKKFFISNILIPKYINFAKYMFIHEFEKDIFPNEFINIGDEDITNIAERIIKRIEVIQEIFEYNRLIEQKKVPLKIYLEIKYCPAKKSSNLYKVQYFIENNLYDSIEFRQDNSNSMYLGASYDSNDFYDYSEAFSNSKNEYKNDLKNPHIHHGRPNILEIAPQIFYPFLFSEYENVYSDFGMDIEYINMKKNQKLESIISPIFLSHKKGYIKLIGAFNDMIHFNKMQYIGPLRFYPERDSTIKELDSDESIVPDSKTSWSLLKKDEKLRDTINEWLQDPSKLKTPYEIQYRKLYDIESSLYKLDFEKFADINSVVKDKNKEINKLGIYYNLSEKQQDIIIQKEIQKELKIDNEGWTKLLRYPAHDKKDYVQQKEIYIAKLVEFSGLNSKEQYKQVFMGEGLLDFCETKEELIFEDRRNNTQLSNRDLGLGISQILPILIATNRNKNMTIAIEQPELHLHPAVQCEIADEFIRSYKKNKNEFLIETHSEHILLRIMKRMRHTVENKIEEGAFPLTPDDVCLLYIDTHKGETFIRELKLDKDGSLLSRWPSGFFEESYNEMFS